VLLSLPRLFTFTCTKHREEQQTTSKQQANNKHGSSGSSCRQQGAAAGIAAAGFVAQERRGAVMGREGVLVHDSCSRPMQQPQQHRRPQKAVHHCKAVHHNHPLPIHSTRLELVQVSSLLALQTTKGMAALVLAPTRGESQSFLLLNMP